MFKLQIKILLLIMLGFFLMSEFQVTHAEVISVDSINWSVFHKDIKTPIEECIQKKPTEANQCIALIPTLLDTIESDAEKLELGKTCSMLQEETLSNVCYANLALLSKDEALCLDWEPCRRILEYAKAQGRNQVYVTDEINSQGGMGNYILNKEGQIIGETEKEKIKDVTTEQAMRPYPDYTQLAKCIFDKWGWDYCKEFGNWAAGQDEKFAEEYTKICDSLKKPSLEYSVCRADLATIKFSVDYCDKDDIQCYGYFAKGIESGTRILPGPDYSDLGKKISAILNADRFEGAPQQCLRREVSINECLIKILAPIYSTEKEVLSPQELDDIKYICNLMIETKETNIKCIDWISGKLKNINLCQYAIEPSECLNYHLIYATSKDEQKKLCEKIENSELQKICLNQKVQQVLPTLPQTPSTPSSKGTGVYYDYLIFAIYLIGFIASILLRIKFKKGFWDIFIVLFGFSLFFHIASYIAYSLRLATLMNFFSTFGSNYYLVVREKLWNFTPWLPGWLHILITDLAPLVILIPIGLIPFKNSRTRILAMILGLIVAIFIIISWPIL